jgi:hypothetical protein
MTPEQIHAMPVESPDFEAAAKQYALTWRPLVHRQKLTGSSGLGPEDTLPH